MTHPAADHQVPTNDEGHHRIHSARANPSADRGSRT